MPLEHAEGGRLTTEVWVPTRGRVRFETATALRLYEPRYCVDKYGLSSVRNKIVQNFLVGTADALVMVDDDVIPPVGFVEDLSAVEDFDILAAVAMIAPKSVFVPNAWKQDTTGVWALTDADSSVPAPADLVGAGCVLIHRRVLEDPEMAQPFSVTEDKHGVRVTGEDMEFCFRARELGYRIGMHWGVVCEHVISDLYATEVRAAYASAAGDLKARG